MFPDRPNLTAEPLEPRTLLAGEPLSPALQLIGMDRLLTDRPALDGAGQTVAVIDTGIDYTHPALGGGIGAGFKVIGGFDFVDNDADPMDTHGHGTAVASIVAANPFVVDGVEHRGIAPAAKLVALRIAPTTAETPNARIQQALQWVLDNRATFNITVANVSFGFGRFASAPENGPFGVLLANLAAAGVIVTAASGNDGVDGAQAIAYPAADADAIAVGSVNDFDVISEFSERGPLLDLLAPGEGWVAPVPGGGSIGIAGTSFAAPAVAGAAAVVSQALGLTSVRDARSILRASGVDNVDGDQEFGRTTGLRFSRIDVAAAAELALARRVDPTVPPPPWTAAQTNDVAYDRDGVLHVVFRDASTNRMMYATQLATGGWSGMRAVDPDPARDTGAFLSLSLDSAGRVGIAYFDGTTGDLKYAAQRNGGFVTETLDARGSVGLYPSTRFLADNRPVIAYFHRTRGDLRLAERLNSGAWRITDIDRDRNDRGRHASLAINSFGRMGVAYEDSTTGKLKYAMQTTAGWLLETVDNDTRGVAYISAAFDAADRLAVSYYDANPADLKYAITDDPFRPNWRTVTVAKRGAVGLFSRLSFDASGEANIVYYQRNTDSLFVARGSITRMVAQRLQTGGGRFSASTLRPDNGAIVYTYYENQQQRLQFGEAFL